MNIEDKHKRIMFLKVMSVLVVFFVMVLKLDLASKFIIVSLVFFPILYFLFIDRLWMLFIPVAPTLIMGKIIFIEIRPDWIYEMSLSELLIIIILAIFLLGHFFNAKLKNIKLDYLTIFLFAFLFLTITFSWKILDFRYYVFGVKTAFYGIASYFLALNLLNTKEKIKWFLYSLAILAGVISIEIFIKFYTMGFSSKFFFERSKILIPMGPIALISAILTLLIPIIAAFYFQCKEKERFAFLIVLSIGILAVFLSLGKAAMLSLIFGLFYLFMKLKEKRIVFILFFSLFVVLSFIFFNSFFFGLLERIAHISVDANIDYRMEEYKIGAKIIKENFWTGVGAGQQLLYFNEALEVDDANYVNNYFLQFFIDLGLFGFIMALTLTWGVLNKAKLVLKKAKEENKMIVYGFVASLIAAFFNGLSEVTFFTLQYSIIFWSIVGVLSNINFYENISNNNKL